MKKRHIAYLKYLLRHKWYVFVAGRRLGVSFWRLLIHDLSKFSPKSEWIPYSSTFYTEDGKHQYCPSLAFDYAWLHHQHNNPHHWQYWILREDSGSQTAMEMKDEYMKEMVADWLGAGRAINGKWEVSDWYKKNREKIILHPLTRNRVELIIDKVTAEHWRN